LRLTKLLLTAAVAVSAATAVPAAAADTVFANITSTSGLNFRWLRGNSANGANAVFGTTASPAGAVGGATLVNFSLTGAPAPLTVVDAQMVLFGSTTNDPLGVTTGAFTQRLDSLSFNITTPTAFSFGSLNFAAGSTLLSGTVLNGNLTGSIGGTTGAIVASAAVGSTVAFDPSPLFTFEPNSQFGFTFNLGDLDPAFTTASSGTALSSFRAGISGGSFQSDPAVTFGVVPEPVTWTMMIAGFGLVGMAARRRRGVAVPA
jgi:hypothetical protein